MKKPKRGTKIWVIDGLSIRPYVFQGTRDGWFVLDNGEIKTPDACYPSKESAIADFLSEVHEVIKKVLRS